MRILFFDWVSFADIDMAEAMRRLGHEILISDIQSDKKDVDEDYTLQCMKLFSENNVELVYTCNFAPTVAEACHRANIPYMSWVYDSPQVLLYHKTILYPTNYVFLFDSAQYIDLKSKGVDTVYFMPLAANVERVDEIAYDSENEKRFSCDVAFVGSLYNEEHNFFDRMDDKLSDYDRGYLEALMEAQMKVYGYYFIEDVLRGQDILGRVKKILPYNMGPSYFCTDEYLCGDYFLGRKLTSNERIRILKELGKRYNTNVYSTGDLSDIKGVNDMDVVEYFDEMPQAFRYAKINLNITLRTIRNGIPLRCFDIMGAGGFLLTNYQADFNGMFEDGIDYVSYESHEDMYAKIDYYLAHEEERKAIAKHGHDTVKQYHNYNVRIKEMFEVLKNARGS